MPGKRRTKKREADPSIKVSPKLVKSIWNHLSIHDWAHVLTTTQQASHWVTVGDRIQGLCPFHQDRNPSFIVDLRQRYAKCFSTNCGRYFWDPVRFYAAIQAVPMNYIAALTELKERFSINLQTKQLKELGTRHTHRVMKKVLFTVLNGELVDAYGTRNAPPPDLAYAYTALDYLDKRKIEPVFAHLPIGILPPGVRLQQLVQAYCVAHQMDDLWEDVKEYLDTVKDTSWIGSLVFFTGSSPDDVAKLKFRKVPVASKTGQPPLKEMKYIPDDYEDHNGVFGLFGTPLYQTSFSVNKISSFCFMEGEFDALSIMSRQFQTQNIGFFAFSGGGGSVNTLDLLTNYGLKTAYVVQDCDSGGEGFIQEILRSTVHVAPRLFTWPQTLRIPNQKDVDPFDAVTAYGLDKFTEEYRKPENFQLPYQWALTHAKRELVDINPDDVRYLTNTAAKWGNFVRDTTEQQVFLADLAKNFNIVTGQVLNAMNLSDDSEEAFIERVRSVLAARLHVMYAYKQGSSHMLRVFDKRTKTLFDMPIAEPKGIRSAIERMVRSDIYKFIREEVGEPGFLKSFEDAVDEGKPFYLTHSAALMGYVANAVTNLCGSLPLDAVLEPLGAGLHCKTEETDGAEHTVLYLVNGMQLYKGVFEDGKHLQWRELEGPSDGPYVVYTTKEDTGPKIIYPQVRNSHHLNVSAPMSLPELYEIVLDVVRSGWDFQHHEVTAQLLAAFILQVPIANCFPRMPQVMFTSEQSSGKSSFLGGLLGRTHVPAINLIQSSYYSDNFTPAGIRQALTYSRMAVCLDEFEDKGGNDRKSSQVRGVLHILRGLANEGGGSTYGTASGAHQEYSVYCPAFLAGIRGLDDAADISRFIIVELDKKLDRQAPETVLLNKFGTHKIRHIRESIPLTMYPNIPELMATHNKIKEEYQDGGGLTYGKITRSRDQFYAPMAIMHAAGRDYHTFIREFYAAYRTNLERIATASLSNDLLNELLHTAAVEVQDMHGMQRRTLNSILSSDNPEMVNETYSGFYFDRPTRWLLVNWGTVRGKVLSASLGNQRGPIWLKSAAARSSQHISDESIRSSGVLERIRGVMGHISKNNLVTLSAFDVSALLIPSVLSQPAPPSKPKEQNAPEAEVPAEAAAKAVNAETPVTAPSAEEPTQKEEGEGESSPDGTVDKDFDY